MDIQRPARPAVSRRQRLLTDDATVVQAEHLPARSGSRELAVVVAHGFMLHSRHPRLRRIAGWLREKAGVVLIDLRGHGGSSGASTLGWHEVHDVEAAVSWARWLGYRRVVTLGFSLGAAVALRHGALYGGVDRIAAVSGPGQWYYRGTARMRLLHRLVLSRRGRLAIRMLRRTNVTHVPWPEPYPLDPVAAAAQLDVPLLVVHGDQDDLFPVEHARRVCQAAGEHGTLWLEPGYGHAEIAVRPDLARRLTDWLICDADGR
ncbi:alpha/beta hydrolase [Phytoactinopolyspora mesophila]|uniref:Alpha/beta fold hydrolase n=1 Tax=Phytoactinopolyspora mesophila TaxID=2650750 RepID=A0A7K3LXY5_9ACTN|nr:alpha/beta fold hydrolase [Phytoactinopolyspora mesophila]NDL55865.1 alpha/beta fold hydrolase [Phytoactinopolyspora mesophila]